MMRRICLPVIAAGLLMSGTAQGELFEFEATIDGAQANAGSGSGSAATGFATVTYDDVTELLSWTIQWDNLEGAISIAHFHGPATPAQNAAAQVGIPDLTSPSVGSATITNAQANDLLNDLWYINIHSSQSPGGEIRGQVTLVPEPSSLALFGVAGLALMRRRR